MKFRAERRLFQVLAMIAAMVPIAAGADGVLRGPAMVHHLSVSNADLDSQFSYLSGLLLGIGVAFVVAAADISRRAALFRALGFIVVLGGIARVIAATRLGLPTAPHRFAYAMELVVVPSLLLWLCRIDRLSGGRVDRGGPYEGNPMRVRKALVHLLPLLLCFSTAASMASHVAKSEPHQVVRIWPGQAPGTEDWKAPEESADVTLPNVGKIHVITNVTVPTLTIFRPAAGRANGTAMVVLPGGSFRALAWDVDGLETAQWLAGKGITAFVLKYRVRPPQNGESFGESLEDFARATRARRGYAVADAEQAIRYVRSHAGQYALAPNRVGIIGFSAGAMATVDVALAKDPLVRPAFAVPMYGAALTPEVPSAGAPPLFIGAAQDDPQLPAINSVEIFQRWTKAGLAAELHIYEKGGHGFGFRRHNLPVDAWPATFQAWLAAHGYLPSVRR